MRRATQALALTVFGAWLSGCLAEPTTDSQTFDASPARRLLLCQQGLSDRTAEWDKGLFALCESIEASGFELLHDGAYPAFGALDEDGAYDALFDALDDDDDGVVTEDDGLASINLIGFSWGGINVADIAERLRLDERIAPSRRRVRALVLLDPFQPQVSRSRIPATVDHAWIYRQTDTTSGDCSLVASLGFGFNGHRPKAMSTGTSCTHYDLDRFLDGIGHCDVPSVARVAVEINVVEGRDAGGWKDWAESCELD